MNWSLRACELPQPDVWLHFNHVPPTPLCCAACAWHPLKATAVTAAGVTFPQTCTRRKGKLRRICGRGGALMLRSLSSECRLDPVSASFHIYVSNLRWRRPFCLNFFFFFVAGCTAQSFDLPPCARICLYEAYWINEVHLDCYHDDDLTGSESARGRRPFVSSKHEVVVQLCCSQVLSVRRSRFWGSFKFRMVALLRSCSWPNTSCTHLTTTYGWTTAADKRSLRYGGIFGFLRTGNAMQ